MCLCCTFACAYRELHSVYLPEEPPHLQLYNVNTLDELAATNVYLYEVYAALLGWNIKSVAGPLSSILMAFCYGGAQTEYSYL